MCNGERAEFGPCGFGKVIFWSTSKDNLELRPMGECGIECYVSSCGLVKCRHLFSNPHVSCDPKRLQTAFDAAQKIFYPYVDS